MQIERGEYSTTVYPFDDNHDYWIRVDHHPDCAPAVEVMLPVMTLERAQDVGGWMLCAVEDYQNRHPEVEQVAEVEA